MFFQLYHIAKGFKVSTSSKSSDIVSEPAEATREVWWCDGGITSLFKTVGESRVALEFRAVHFLVVEGSIGNLGSRLPFMMKSKLQQTEKLPGELINRAMLPGNGARK